MGSKYSPKAMAEAVIRERYQGLDIEVKEDPKDPRIVTVSAYFPLDRFQMVVDQSDVAATVAVLVALLDHKLPKCVCPVCDTELKAGLKH